MTIATPPTASVIDTARDASQESPESTRSRLRHVADATTEYTRRGLDRVRDTGATLRDSAVGARDATVGYTREEPVKALLIAAAAGAAIASSVMLIRRFMRR